MAELRKYGWGEAHRPEPGFPTVRVYVWELPVRISHWFIFLPIFVLSFTGYYMHNPFIVAKSTDRKSTRLNSSHSLHAALPICLCVGTASPNLALVHIPSDLCALLHRILHAQSVYCCQEHRSEEHTSELQSLPTRRSSDLFMCGNCQSESRTGSYSFRSLCSPSPDTTCTIRLLLPRAQIGRAHV